MRYKRDIIWLIAIVMLLSACSRDTEASDILTLWPLRLCRLFHLSEMPRTDKNNRPVDQHGRHARIGHLGSKAMAIPGSVYLVGWMHYQTVSEQHYSSAGKYSHAKTDYNKISYSWPIKDFRFEMRLTDGAVRQYNDPTYQDWFDDERKPKPFPWTTVNVQGIAADEIFEPNQNHFLASLLQGRSATGRHDYRQQPQQVYGLSYYQISHSGITAASRQNQGENAPARDILVERNARGDVNTLIECDEPAKAFAHCYQYFKIPEMRAWISFDYDRHYLPQWQKMAVDIKTVLNGWVVNPEQLRQYNGKR